MDRRHFKRLASRYNLIPIVRERLGDEETPVSAYRRMRGQPGSFLLESVEGGDRWGRYSILGSEAAGRFRAHGDRVSIRWNGRERSVRTDDPLAELRRWLRRFRPAPVEGLPAFFGGAVGTLHYDVVRSMERLPDRHRTPESPPEVDLLLVTDLIVFDNLSHTLKLVTCAQVGRNPDRAYDAAMARLDALEDRLREPLAPREVPRRAQTPRWRSRTRKSDFGRKVETARRYIHAGDIFQVVLSHELRCRLRADPFDVYRALRCINPSPYMFHLDLDDRVVLGASPEVLVRVEGDRAWVRPIAGTRRRGSNEEEDRARIDDLRGDAKERAEHVMLVDLGRNDLGRVCRFGSVTTDDLMTIERYSHVIHLVSHVSGTLRPGQDCFDALRACFPAGTVSGAPKIRAMEIIDELEDRRRGEYAGAVGYFGFGGSMDTCIAIRTIVCQDGEARVGVGAGIVLDSTPEREWQETMEKSDAARAAVEMAERGLTR